MDNDPDTPWEARLRADLQAESIKLSRPHDDYWQLVIINSKNLKHIMGDEHAVSEKCDEIKKRVLVYEAAAALPSADRLRIVMIQSSNFLIFHSTHHKTITCTLHDKSDN